MKQKASHWNRAGKWDNILFIVNDENKIYTIT